MPAYDTYYNMPALLARIVANMTANGNKENTGQRTQDLLEDLAQSLYNIITVLPSDVVNSFPAWSGGTTYVGGSDATVSHEGQLYLLVSETDNTGTEPGTNALVWLPFSMLSLAHFKDLDQYLDKGGPSQVSAQEIREHMNAGLAVGTSLYVNRTTGRDTGAGMGVRGKLDRQYETLGAAYNASQPGDRIVVLGSGSYPLNKILGASVSIDAPDATIDATTAPYGVLMAENAPTVAYVRARAVNRVWMQQNATMVVQANVTGDVRAYSPYGAGNVTIIGDVGSVVQNHVDGVVKIKGNVLGNVTLQAGTVIIEGSVFGTITKTGGNLTISEGSTGAIIASGTGLITATHCKIGSITYPDNATPHPELLAIGCAFGQLVDTAEIIINAASAGNVGMVPGGGGGGAATWGGISGTLSAQSDLQAALDAKEDDGVAAAAVAAHVAALDPHGDRAYADGKVATEATERDAAIAAAIDALVTGAPGALDTLNELAAALGDDPNFAATVTALVAAKEDALAAGTTAQYYRGDKSWQTLATAVAATPAVTANTAKVTNATHTGDVTGATALTIGANKVTNAKAAQMPANTLKGNNTGAAANQADLTVAQTKVMLALDAVDNTSDANKPVSTAQAAALASRAPLASPAFTGTPTVPTAALGTNTTQSASTAFVVAALAAEVTDRNNAIAAAVVGLSDDRGTYDASANLFPAAGGSGSGGSVLRGDYWMISVAGVLDGGAVNPGDVIRALSDGPGQTAALWYIDAARQNASTTEAENRATTDNKSVLTPVTAWKLADKALSASPLTGMVGTTATPALDTDTPVVAIGKTQGQINAMTGTLWARLTLNQTGTAAPVITGRVGNITTITAARTATGEYTLTVTGGGLTANKTHVVADYGLAAPLGQLRAGRATGTVVGVKTFNSAGAAADDMLVDTTIEIHVEP